MSERDVAAVAASLVRSVTVPSAAAEMIVLAGDVKGTGLVCEPFSAADAERLLGCHARPPVGVVAAVAGRVADRDLCLRLAEDPRKTVKRALAASPYTHPDARMVLARWADAAGDEDALREIAAHLPASRWLEPLAGGRRLVDWKAAQHSLAVRAHAGLSAEDVSALLAGAPAAVAAPALSAVVEGRTPGISCAEARDLVGSRWVDVFATFVGWCAVVDAGVAAWAVEACTDPRVRDGLAGLHVRFPARPGASSTPRSFDAGAAAVVVCAVEELSGSGSPVLVEGARALVSWLVSGDVVPEWRDTVQRLVLHAGGPVALRFLDAHVHQDAAGVRRVSANVVLESHWMSPAAFSAAAAWFAGFVRASHQAKVNQVILKGCARALLKGPVRFDSEVRVALACALGEDDFDVWIGGGWAPNVPEPGEPAQALSLRLRMLAGVDRSGVGVAAASWLNRDPSWVSGPHRDELLGLCGEAALDVVAGASGLSRPPGPLVVASAALLSESFGSDVGLWHAFMSMSGGWHGSVVELVELVKLQQDS